MQHHLHGFFISRSDGTHLVKYLNNPDLKSELLSSFVAGIFLFGKESVGQIEEIVIKGLDVEVLIVYKHDLILTALFSADMHKLHLKSEAEAALDMFYEKYGDKLGDWCGTLDDFADFENHMHELVQQYFEKVQTAQNQSKDEKLGFWRRIFGK